MKRLARFCMLLVIGLVARPAFADDFVECSSQSGNVQHCPADTRGGVWLSSQYSRAGCFQNDTWGYDSRGIWVSNGCRAQFRLGESRRGHGDKAATAAAALLIGAAIAAAADKHAHDRDRRHDRRYDDDYDEGCSAGRRGKHWSDYESEGWRNGYRDCR